MTERLRKCARVPVMPVIPSLQIAALEIPRQPQPWPMGLSTYYLQTDCIFAKVGKFAVASFNSLSSKASLFVVSLCLATIFVLMALAHLALSSNTNVMLEQDAEAAKLRAVDVLEKIGDRVNTYSAIYASNIEVAGVTQSGDKAAMKELFVRLFKQTAALDPVVGSMEITNNAGVVLMRGHNPGQAGDDKSKEPLVRRALEGRPARGLTVSPSSGEVATDAVHPIMSQGKLVGTLKIGSRFRASTAAEIKRISGAESILIYRGKVNASTIPDVKSLELSPGSGGLKTGVQILDIAGKSYAASASSVPVEGADPLIVMALTDRGPALAQLSQFELGIGLKALLLLALGLPIVILLARRSVRAIEDLTVSMRELAGGALDTPVPHRGRRDEIGAMAAAIDTFKENARQVRAFEEQEKAEAAARLARAESMASVVSDVGEVVAAAAAGDFSARLHQIDHADGQMQKLVAGINQINAVVDSATTEFAATLKAVAGGDLTQRIDTAYRGRFAELKTAINETVDRLSETVRTIQVTSASVELAAREINIGAEDLSKRTEEQASSLEQTAATTEELAASVKASAQASRQAATISDEAMQAAQTGGLIANDAVGAMARIETASKKISDIIRVIDDIAFQTNLLALNAAVEAARAGDSGKGFAVVASEVRTLAQRSGAAAKDISALISSSNAEVGEGVKLVRRAGEALNQILAASEKVAATIADISSASGEQADGIEEMSLAVAHLDAMTQQNAALAEESAASATSLADRIGQLNALVAAFNTGQTATKPAHHGTMSAHFGKHGGSTSEPTRLRAVAEAPFRPFRATG